MAGWTWIAVGSVADAGPLDAARSLGDPLATVRAPLEAAGWEVAADHASTWAPGDVFDPNGNQVQILGTSCFPGLTPRTGASESFEAAWALDAALHARIGWIGASAQASASQGLQLRGATVAEVAVADLRPSASCLEQLQAFAAVDQPVGSWRVVSAVLTADFEASASMAGSASVSAPAAGVSSAVGVDHRRAGVGLTIALRTEPVSTWVETAGAAVAAKSSKKVSKKPPCWIEAPCAPWPSTSHTQKVGHGTTVGAADQAAVRSLLGDLDQRRAAALAEVTAAGVVVEDPGSSITPSVAARYGGSGEAWSLAVVDRAAAQRAIEHRIHLIDGAAVSPLEDRLVAWSDARRARDDGAERALLAAELVWLGGRPGPAPSLAELVAAEARARSALDVVVPDDAWGTALDRALGGVGIRPRRASTGGDLRIEVAVDEQQGAPIGGLIPLTLEATVALQVGAQRSDVLVVSMSGGAETAASARAILTRALEAEVASRVVKVMFEEEP